MDKLGKYEVLDKIGEGGWGTVYRGRDPDLKRTVALKQCIAKLPDLRERFLREAEIAANLQHPNITTVYDCGLESDQPYLVQELLAGEDLDDIISRKDELPLETCLDMLLQIAEGLGYAHQQGVVHRDVKPGNIRILEGHRVKIMDFGIAKVLSEDKALTKTGITLGTAGYIAPEQIQDKGTDHRSDIFAFGILAYELLAHQKPFEGESVSTVLYRIVFEEPAPLQELWPDGAPELVACVHKCLAKDPEDRYQGFDEVIEVLQETRVELFPGVVTGGRLADGDHPLPSPDTAKTKKMAPPLPPQEPVAATPDKQEKTRTGISEAFAVPSMRWGLVAAAAAAVVALLLAWWLWPGADDGDKQEVAELAQEKVQAPVEETQAEEQETLAEASSEEIQVERGSSAAAPVVTTDGSGVVRVTASSLALVAQDATASSALHGALRSRFPDIRLYSSLAEAKSAASQGGPRVAAVLASKGQSGASQAYGTGLSTCEVTLTAQILSLPDGALLFTRSRSANAPDCNAATRAAASPLAQDLLGNVSTPARVSAASLTPMTVAFRGQPSKAQVQATLSSLRSIPGVHKASINAEGSVVELEIDREIRSVARDIGNLPGCRIVKVAGNGVTVELGGG